MIFVMFRDLKRLIRKEFSKDVEFPTWGEDP